MIDSPTLAQRNRKQAVFSFKLQHNMGMLKQTEDTTIKKRKQ